jgi:hypothetical protein
MARPAPPTRIERTIQIDDMADLSDAVAWFHDLHIETAQEELATAQAGGSLLDPTTFVDGKKNGDVDEVNLFGNITYVGGMGPVDEAIQAAWAFVEAAAPVRTGHYRQSLAWFANGQMTGAPPQGKRLGLRGNAELVDLAPYAAMAEIMVPKGVIYGAYVAVSRRFGKTVSVSYRYTRAERYGGFMLAPGMPAPKRPYNVPVLTIGNPSSSVKPGVARSRPGYNIRRRRATVRKYLRAKGLT